MGQGVDGWSGLGGLCDWASLYSHYTLNVISTILNTSAPLISYVPTIPRYMEVWTEFLIFSFVHVLIFCCD